MRRKQPQRSPWSQTTTSKRPLTCKCITPGLFGSKVPLAARARDRAPTRPCTACCVSLMAAPVLVLQGCLCQLIELGALALLLQLLMVAAGMKPIMPPEPEVDPKAKKAKPKAGDPPPPPRLLEAWTGPHSVYVVEVRAYLPACMCTCKCVWRACACVRVCVHAYV